MTSVRRLSATSVLCLLVPCLLALVAGCGGADEQAAVTTPGGAVSQQTSDNDGFRGVGLTQPYQMPDLTLTDTAGRPFNLVSDTDARVTLVFFGYTNCPDVCSLVMADMASALTRLSPRVAGDVQLLFVTTDPARDTPEVVGEYVDRFHPAFEGLTGPLPRIKAAAEPLGVAIQGTNRLPSGGYEVGHGSQIVGFTADDKARVVWTEGTPVDDLVSDIHALADRSG
ncbi:MAG TPA: SCO family protein [Nocardioidaceae bacterium]|nr:SCO family protein [Nocardioidaceae bacterium]